MIDSHEQTPMVIFAIDEPDGIDGNAIHGWFQSWCKDRGLGVKPLEGCYKGEKERSYVMNADVEPQLWHTWCRRQESILFLTGKVPDAGRQAWLHYADGKQEFIGVWKKLSAFDALVACENGQGYTYDPTSGQYWRTA